MQSFPKMHKFVFINRVPSGHNSKDCFNGWNEFKRLNMIGYLNKRLPWGYWAAPYAGVPQIITVVINGILIEDVWWRVPWVDDICYKSFSTSVASLYIAVLVPYSSVRILI